MSDERLLREMGLRISAKRHERGMTQEQLAEKMDVSIQMISNLEGGKKAIRPENLLNLCRALCVSADYILCGSRSEICKETFAEEFSRLSPKKQSLIRELVTELSNE